MKLPGYILFTVEVLRTIKERKWLYIRLVALLAFANGLFVGLASQDLYTELVDALAESGKDIFSGGWGEIGKAGLLLITGVSGSFAPSVNESQQIYAVLLFTFTWLIVVWLLRGQLAGAKPRLRDGLYSCGAPLIATVIIINILVLQAVPAAIGVIVYSSLVSTDVSGIGVIALLIFLGAALLVLLSTYLIVSTFFALIVVTLPGMYPWQAIKTAGDLVIGRRLRILFRMGWLVIVILVLWALVMIPVIIISTQLQQRIDFFSIIPIVPVVLLVLTSASSVFAAAYTYLFYRKVVDDDAKPA